MKFLPWAGSLLLLGLIAGCSSTNNGTDGGADAPRPDTTLIDVSMFDALQPDSPQIDVTPPTDTPDAVDSPHESGTCPAGFADCNGSAADGCETDLTRDVSHCGTCATACAGAAHATAACSASICGLTCATGFADCDGSAANGCEINTGTDSANCGGCGTACTFANATGACAGGTCAIAACATTFGNCDGIASNGCETDLTRDASHCGTCTTACMGATHAMAACTASTCSLNCTAGFADCDGSSANGCEASLSAPANCGACSTVCPASAPMCSSSGGAATCITGCAPAQTPCSGSCVDIDTDANNCGACSHSCPPATHATPLCAARVCGITCAVGFADCNGNTSDGCETSATTITNCGSCGNACAIANASPVCTGGACAVGACNTGFGNCDGIASNGCEIDTQTNVANCGTCGSACPARPNAASSCLTGACTFACNPGFADCNGNATDGCEVNLQTSAANCGSCATACDGTRVVNATGLACDGAGLCTYGACTSGFADCDGMRANGCETALNTVSNCNSCGAACPTPAHSTASCIVGVCSFICDAGYSVQSGVCGPVPAPRPISPLSTSTVSSRRPTLRWALASGTDGAHVEICTTRACTTVITSFDATGSTGAPSADLPSGVVFWRLRGRSGGGSGTALSPTWQFVVGARTAPVNTSWGTTPDVNGDGFADLAVGAVGVTSYTGRAYIYLGRAAGLPNTPAETLNAPDGANSQFGTSVASAGDVNGDGYSDLVVGAIGVASSAGRAYVYLGSATGLSVTPATTLSGLDGANGNFGNSVAGAGDLNGDGYADVVVGAPGAIGSTGRAYVYLGGAAGLSASPVATLTGPDGVNGYFGFSVSSAGDVNGDAYADLIVGAYGASGSTGRAYVYPGSATGLSATPSNTVTGPDGANGLFGYALANGGDVNGDGYADLVVGAYGAVGGAGRMFVYPVTAAGLSAAPSTAITGPDGANGGFGYSVAGAGDVNGDGYSDLVVSAYLAPYPGPGRVFVFNGGAAGVSGAPATSLTGTDVTFSRFGWSVAGIGDTNGDGYVDIAIGTPEGVGFAGVVQAFCGSATGVSLCAGFSAPDSGSFGYSVASAGHENRSVDVRARDGGERANPT